jgi:tetratricopeptide (TPR) repeat protein
LLILLVSLWGCSRKKNTFTRRAYHNTTARYNAYFNGREINKEALQTLEDAHVDDYSLLLPLFIYGDEESSKAIYPQMDEVIKKCSKVIERHSIYLKKEEHVRWIDDSYMLIGRARFYKREYFGALEIFEYVERAYKKEPVRFEAMIWMARTYMEIESDVNAQLTLEKIESASKMPPQYIGDFNAVYADYLIREERYDEAIPRLERAIVNTKKKKLRRRFTYILAQLYHRKEDYTNASKYYTAVLKLKPDYIMDFNARINRAKAYDVEAKDSGPIKKELNKMLRDRKNAEFYDQVYFALAELAFRERDDSLGIVYLQKSASSSVNNTKQKSLAYLRLGHIYFDRPDYVLAQAYYDSTSGILETTHPDFELVKERLEGLTKLVNNLNEVALQDSLQQVAAMDEKDRQKLIRKLIREVEIEEERRRQELENSFLNPFDANSSRAAGGGEGAGKWYFYNQSTKSIGTTEFFTVWGNRKLEDNWRRSNKQTTNFAEIEEANAAGDTTGGGLTNKDEAYYLKDLPLTDSALSVSHNKIIEALYQIGVIYKEDFNDHPKSIGSFEEMIDRYDTCRYVLSAYYQIYRSSLLLGDQERANYYKDRILTEYEFSEYARLIKNPSYARQRRNREEKIEAFYNATYQLYDYNQYRDVVEGCITADTLFGKNELKPKFDLLKALAIGKLGDREAFIKALNEVIINHPGDKVKDKADELLKQLQTTLENREEEAANANAVASVAYKPAPETEHVFVIIVPQNGKMTSDKVKISIANFNSRSFGTQRLTVNAVLLDMENQLISVRGFENKAQAMNYYNAFIIDEKVLGEVNRQRFERFVLTNENFALFYKDKNIAGYQGFFEENYLQ